MKNCFSYGFYDFGMPAEFDISFTNRFYSFIRDADNKDTHDFKEKWGHIYDLNEEGPYGELYCSEGYSYYQVTSIEFLSYKEKERMIEVEIKINFQHQVDELEDMVNDYCLKKINVVQISDCLYLDYVIEI